ncbi:HAMP domain-containing sensor histidine kinase [Lentzea sp. DG1S-22]|uniref:sensor histidine kinase n=1 Tax=Lentzea sp. DG1S-22 TaxID=3108822 RepID=UPI002E75DA8B|nr:HAMP domain-containing sensor histidine kinase [Lentzea sp. DG1S-22]WVH83756.1 HAMP domain-containing sensor histidine kinase [Lentzea sp. DG1S-22]
MRSVITRALLLAAGLVTAVFLATAGFLAHSNASSSAAAADRQDVAVVAGVLAVSSDADAVRGTIARTRAGAEGRLSVVLASGTRLGAGGGAPAASVSGAVVSVVPAAVPFPFGAVFLIAGIALAALGPAVWLGHRPFTPVLAALRELSSSVGRRVRLRGPRELEELAASIDEASSRTAQLLAKEREMIADVSHRLRTPLAALRLDADAIGPGPVADRIRSAVSTLGHDVDRIIQALQPAEGESPGTCDVASVVEARMGFWSAHAADQGRVCEVDVGEPCRVALSPDALGAVVDALLENVFRHTPPAAPVGVSVVRHAGWVTLVVEDGGTGVADPSSALHRGSSGGGSTGLGLDIARAAAEATGGTIHLEKGRLGGARVRLRFGEANSHHEPASPRAWRLWRGHP